MLKKNISNQIIFEKTTQSINIIASEKLVEKLIAFFIKKKKKDMIMNGFEKGTIPEEYIKEHYSASLAHHIECVIYNFYAHDLIIKNLRSFGSYIPKILSVKKNIDINKNLVEFNYTYTEKLINFISLPEFKKVKFPERKKYKDLDKQAYLLVQSEQKNELLYANSLIQENDWIAIDIFLTDDNEKIDDNLTVKMWLQITSEGIDREIRKVFLNRKVGDTFLSDAFFLHEALSTDFLKHIYLVTIKDHVSSLFFSLKNFKNTFLGQDKNVYEKIIDIFSLRNDISLKKEKSQLSLKYFLEKIKILIEQKIIQEHEEIIKNKILKNPDYLLYQSDINFLNNIKKLACQQAMEKILIDYFIYIYNITIDSEAIYSCLNILQRHRLKDFLYFDTSQVYDNTIKSTLIFNTIIEQMALREKAIEYIIQKLS